MSKEKEAIKKIDAEAKRRYPVNWRHRNLSEQVETFDDGLDSRSAFVAGAAYVINESTELRKENEELKDKFEDVVKWHKTEHGKLTSQRDHYKALAEAASNYISKCPCDPDIYPDQFEAWQKYQSLKTQSPDKEQQDWKGSVIEILEECEDYMDSRADADHNGESLVPNKEMRLLSEIRNCLEKLK